MPQGGIDSGEEPYAAALRELYEETNIRSVEKLGEIGQWLTYDIPRDIVGAAWHGKFRGQKQKWYALRFTGKIQQTPPPFSAKKIAGVPAYKLARKNKEVNLEPVEVDVRELVITTLTRDTAAFQSHVSGGTYLRSIAHDIGQILGIGAHLASLRRTSVAEFELPQAHKLEKVQEAALAGPAALGELFVHPREILPGMPSVTADEDTAGRIRHGMAINLPETSRAGLVKVFAGQRELIAIVSRVAGTLFQPKIVLG